MPENNENPKDPKPQVVVVKHYKKKPGPKEPSKAGRPTAMSELVLAKLREAYLMDCTDEEACCNADISVTTLYRYQQDNPEYVEQKKKWKQTPFLMARAAIINGFSQSKQGGELAIKYLERKKKDEFSIRQEVTGKDGEKLNVGIVQLPLRTKGPAGGNDKG